MCGGGRADGRCGKRMFMGLRVEKTRTSCLLASLKEPRLCSAGAPLLLSSSSRLLLVVRSYEIGPPHTRPRHPTLLARTGPRRL